MQKAVLTHSMCSESLPLSLLLLLVKYGEAAMPQVYLTTAIGAGRGAVKNRKNPVNPAQPRSLTAEAPREAARLDAATAELLGVHKLRILILLILLCTVLLLLVVFTGVQGAPQFAQKTLPSHALLCKLSPKQLQKSPRIAQDCNQPISSTRARPSASGNARGRRHGGVT